MWPSAAAVSMARRPLIAAALLAAVQTAGGFIPARGTCSPAAAPAAGGRVAARRPHATALHADAKAGAADAPAADQTEPCNVVLTTTNCDFDSLAAACALASLWGNDDRFNKVPTHVVMPRGAFPVVQRFLAYHKHVLPVRGFKTIDGADIEALGVVDASSAARLGRSKKWLENCQSLHVYDHHVGGEEGEDNLFAQATEVVSEPVGSATTLIVERLKDADVSPSVPKATLYVLGIRADTGGLAYETTTARDAEALAWLLRKGASQAAIAEFGVERISGDQRKILATALRTVESRHYRGINVATVAVRSKGYVPGLAAVVEELLELTAADVLIMAIEHQNGLDLIGRARPGAATVDLRTVMHRFGGGGHARAAAAAVPEHDRKAMGAPRNVLDVAREYVLGQIPAEPTASAIMTSSVVTLKDDATIADARRLLDAHGLKATTVVDAEGLLRGVLKMSDVSKAEKKGQHTTKVKGVMRTQVTTVSRDTPLAQLEEILVTTVGRVPVVEDDGRLLGIVTRTDLLRLRNYYGGSLERSEGMMELAEAGPGS